jgi:nicotinamidase-related amidase
VNAAPLLVCLDLQRSFLEEGPLAAPRGALALVECARLISLARARRWAVVHCFLRRPSGNLRIERHEARPIAGFEPRRAEPVIERETLSAYGNDAFDALLEQAPGRSALIAGLSASVTFMATAFDAFERGHRFVLASEALASQAGFEASAEQHEAVARDVAARLGFPASATFQEPGHLDPARTRITQGRNEDDDAQKTE